MWAPGMGKLSVCIIHCIIVSSGFANLNVDDVGLILLGVIPSSFSLRMRSPLEEVLRSASIMRDSRRLVGWGWSGESRSQLLPSLSSEDEEGPNRSAKSGSALLMFLMVGFVGAVEVPGSITFGWEIERGAG